MKHPHKKIIEQWLDDTEQEIEYTGQLKILLSKNTILSVLADYENKYDFCIKHKKPPPGLKPIFIHNENRIIEIKSAIERYNEVNKEISVEWFDELNDLTFKIGLYKVPVQANFDGSLLSKPDEYEHLRQAIRDGKDLEFYSYINTNGWTLCDKVSTENKNCNVKFNLPANHYRIHDPYRELKEAQERGERVICSDGNSWFDINTKCDFQQPVDNYKIADDDIVVNGYFVPFSTKQNTGMTGKELLLGTNIIVTKSGLTGKITAEVVE